MLDALPISFLSWLFWLYLTKSISYEAPHYAIYPASYHFIPLQSKYSPRTGGHFKIISESISDVRLSHWFTVHVNSAPASLNSMDVGSFKDVSEIHAASGFRVEVIRKGWGWCPVRASRNSGSTYPTPTLKMNIRNVHTFTLCKELYRLGYNAVKPVESQPTFRRNVTPPYSGSKESRWQAELSLGFLAWLILRPWIWRRHVPRKRRLTELFIRDNLKSYHFFFTFP
jgi:hypothetical protein